MRARDSIRPAVETDFLEFYGKLPPLTTRAVVATHDGKVVGVAGVMLEHGCWFVFTDISTEISRKQIMYGVRAFKKMMDGTSLPFITTREESIESSERFLVKLGFKKIETGEYICQALK